MPLPHRISNRSSLGLTWTPQGRNFKANCTRHNDENQGFDAPCPLASLTFSTARRTLFRGKANHARDAIGTHPRGTTGSPNVSTVLEDVVAVLITSTNDPCSLSAVRCSGLGSNPAQCQGPSWSNDSRRESRPALATPGV